MTFWVFFFKKNKREEKVVDAWLGIWSKLKIGTFICVLSLKKILNQGENRRIILFLQFKSFSTFNLKNSFILQNPLVFLNISLCFMSSAYYYYFLLFLRFFFFSFFLGIFILFENSRPLGWFLTLGNVFISEFIYLF